MSSLPAPRNVSPLIRFSRWAALTTGVIYGVVRLSYLRKKETKIQEVQNKIKAARDAKINAEREAKAKAELDALAKEAGILK